MDSTGTEEQLRREIHRLEAALEAKDEALRELQKSDERYRTIFENIQDVYFETTLDGTILEASPSLTGLSGYPREQVIGTSISAVYQDPGDRQRLIEALATRGIVTDYEISLKNAEGRPIACALSARLMRDAAGAPEKICGVMRPIEERKRFERALAESELLYRTLVEQSPFSVARIGADGRFVFVNTQLLSWLGLPAEAVIGHGPEVFATMMAPEMFQAMTEAVTGALAGVAKTECELLFTRLSGAQIWIAQVAYPWRSTDGQILGAEVHGYDITKRKQAEDILKASAETFSRIFNLGPLISTLTTLADGRFLEVNDAFVQVTGYTREEVLGRPALSFNLIDPAVRQRANAELLKNGYAVTEAKVKLKSGEQRTGLFYARLIALGPEPCLLQTVLDITDLKRGQDALEQSNRELESRVRERTAELVRANAELEKQIAERHRMEEERRVAEQQLQHIQRMESLGLLAGGIAHDFNNLLAGIFGNISLARLSAPGQGELVELLDQTLGLFSRAKALTQQLLTFSRGGQPLKKVQQLDGVLRNTVKFATTGSDISVQLELPGDLWPCDVDENQIGQVVENIVINARQAMPSGGSLTVAARNVTDSDDLPAGLPAGSYVQVAITDTGPGIAPKHLPFVFDPFFTTKQEGSGLGLATAYSIVKKHGGLLGVTSELGKGASFCFYAPAAPGSRPSLLVAPVVRPAARGHILVMDDEPFIRRFLERALAQMGCTVRTVANGADAVEAYEQAQRGGQPFDLVILDLTVPGGMGGKSVLEKLLAIDPQVKAVAASGFSEDPIMAEPRSAGFRRSIAKPFTVEQVAAAVREVLGGEDG